MVMMSGARRGGALYGTDVICAARKGFYEYRHWQFGIAA